MHLKFSCESFANDSDILCALRGPDVVKTGTRRDEWEELKEFTTARVRSSVLQPCSVGYAYPGAVRETPLTQAERVKRDLLLNSFTRQFGSHFHAHYLDAVSAVRDQTGYDLEVEAFR